jgi:hypothetical protein
MDELQAVLPVFGSPDFNPWLLASRYRLAGKESIHRRKPDGANANSVIALPIRLDSIPISVLWFATNFA